MRWFAQALARRRARCAFPDDFTIFAQKLQSRLTAKHDKNSEEGRALRALREIRVRAAPAWDASEVELMFWFVRTDQVAGFERSSWDVELAAWLKLVNPSGRFMKVEGQVAELDEMSALDYVESDPLDLDYLSSRGQEGTSPG